MRQEGKWLLLIFSVLLTKEISDGLESLLLPHHKADRLFSLSSQQLAVTDASLFPLLVGDTVQFDSHFKNALKVLFARLCFNFGQIYL